MCFLLFVCDSMVGEGRYIADRIAGAKFVELPGEDHFVSIDPDQILDPVEEFVTGSRPPKTGRHKLATILFVDIVDSTGRVVALGDQNWKAVLDGFQQEGLKRVREHNGRLVNTTGDGFVATFDGPARAIRCGSGMRDACRKIDLEVRCGIHTAEIEDRGADIAGVGVHVAARISDLASAGEVWVSRTVKDLVSGSGFDLKERGTHRLKGIEEPWTLYVAGL